jgi:hypothetical protein
MSNEQTTTSAIQPGSVRATKMPRKRTRITKIAASRVESLEHNGYSRIGVVMARGNHRQIVFHGGEQTDFWERTRSPFKRWLGKVLGL